MKNLSFVLVIIVFILLYVVYYFSAFSFRNLLPLKKVPAKYNTYQFLTDTPTSANYSLHLLTSQRYKERQDPPLLDTIQHIVVIPGITPKVVKTDEDRSDDPVIYYKLDSFGNLIDSFTVSANYPPLITGGYMLFPRGYSKWLLTGDTSLHAYITLNKNDDYSDTATIQSIFHTYYSTSKAMTYYNSFRVSKSLYRAIFVKDGFCYELYGNDIVQDNASLPEKDESQFVKMENRVDNKHPDVVNKFVYLDYFHKMHFEKEKHNINFGLGTDSGLPPPDRWEGVGYINLLFGGDTVGIKQKLSKTLDKDDMQYRNDSYPKYGWETCYYTHPLLHFGIYYTDHFSIYLIKAKNK